MRGILSMKSFIITVDTEGDNLWNYEKGSLIRTENVNFIPRFQELCNKYGFKPVWLTNYEMIMSDDYVNYIKGPLAKGQCEVGIHVHAWNNPPLYQLDAKYNGNPYLIEYPDEIMRAKFKTTYDLIEKRLGIKVKSHRSGRWAMDDRYFKLLEDFGIICDCSYTPGVSWAKAEGETILGGSDYCNVPKVAHMVGDVLEVPATVRSYSHYLAGGSLKHKLRAAIKGGSIWLRPALSCLSDMKKVAKDVMEEDCSDYLEFMVHSSELMPGGSPYFTTEQQVNILYEKMESLFKFVQSLGYEGETLESYANRHIQ